MISLKEAIKFHGHLGPYLVLGLLAGWQGVRSLGCKRHFGLEVKVWGADKKPKSCLIDGLQLSTGATFGKGNIKKIKAPAIKILIRDCVNNKQIVLRLKRQLICRLSRANTHILAERLAKEIYGSDNITKLFILKRE
ncbi:MAG: formylmethanofuran dehydrogenase subunit E family protein [Candidatus Omnitrophota bacterium]|jgi:formylmethanofuran dehydrogenase subunit E